MKILPIICVSIALTACSTPKMPKMPNLGNKNDKQNLSINTPNVVGATCDIEIDNKAYRVKTPENIVIKKSETGQNLNVTCSNPGYETATKSIEPRVGAREWWPVLSGNVYQTGEKGVNSFQYPDQINIDLKPTTVAQSAPISEPVVEESQEIQFVEDAFVEDTVVDDMVVETEVENATIDWVEAPVIMTETEALQPDVVLEPMVKVNDTINANGTLDVNNTVDNVKLTTPKVEMMEPIDVVEPMQEIQVMEKIEKQVPKSFVSSNPVSSMESIKAPVLSEPKDDMTAPILSTPLQENKYDDVSKGNLAVCKAGLC